MVEFLFWIQTVSAADIEIQPSGTNDALFSAVKRAQSGDRIVLGAGAYQECVNTLGKDLILEGKSGAQIVGNGSCTNLLEISAGEVWIQNLTLSHKNTCIFISGRNSKVHLNESSLLQCGNSRINGGGAKIEGGTLWIESSKISGNQAQKGAGIFITKGVLNLKDTLMADNMAQIGGALLAHESEVTISDSRVLGNTTKSGGMGAGVAMRNGGYLTVTDSLFQGNHAQGKGGAIYADNSSSTAHNHIVLKTIRCTGNSASFGSSTGGCLYSRGRLSLEVEGSRFVDNMAALSGGALAIHDAGEKMEIDDSVFQKNRARSGEGGALLVEASTEKVSTPVSIRNSTFDSNRAETYGGALSLGNTINSYANLDVQGSTFTNNQANSSQSGAGGAIYFVSQAPHTLRVVESTFERNKAELAGGAIYAIHPQMVWIQYSQFYNNSAQGASTIQPRFGGAVMLDGATVTFVEHSKFCGNTASSMGGKRSSGIGGALYLQKGERLVFEHNWVWENTAQEYGGGISVDGLKNVEFAESLFAANRSEKGGVIHLSNSSSVAKDMQVAFTQAGVATSQSGSGKHQWTNVNWYNNVDGNGFLGTSPDLPSALTSHSERNPNFEHLVVDGRCDDTLLLTE